VDDGAPVWPAAPAVCPVEATTAEEPGGRVVDAASDAASGWAQAVLEGGPAERWAAEGVATPAGPWTGHVERADVNVSALGDGGLWVAVTGWWGDRLWEAGWRVEVAPAGGEFEVVSVGPARAGGGATVTTRGDWMDVTTTTGGDK
jgi:hypothetical protein